MESRLLLHTIKQAFRAKRIKQLDVANKLNITDKSVSNYLNSRNEVGINTLLDMVDMAGLDIIIRDRDTRRILLADNYWDNHCYEELATREQRIDRVMKQLRELLEEES